MDTRIIINLFHILLVAPFLIWIGITRGNLPEVVFPGLLGLGIFIVLYHGYKAWVRYGQGSQYIWINLIHMLWVGPLLVYIGAGKKETQRPSYDLLLLTAFGALGYHLYLLATQYDFL
jgi:hypothetical protein